MPSAEQRIGGLRYVSFLIAPSRGAAIEVSPASSAANCREREEEGSTSPGGTIESDSQRQFTRVLCVAPVAWEKVHRQTYFFLLTVIGSMEAMTRIFELGVVHGRWTAEQARGSGGAPLRRINRHTMPSNCPPKPLKTNDRHAHKVTHIFEGRAAGFFAFSISSGGQQRPHAA
jgi:hypothetical protein